MNYTKNDIQPPRWSLQLLKFFVKKNYLEEIEGDMEEVFEDNLEIYSTKKARRLYNREVIKLLKPNLVRALGGNHQLNYFGMLQHNLLITLRGFWRHKTSFLINLIGLSTGLAAALLIFLWVQDERSIDTFHEKNDQLYWVMANFAINDDVRTWDYTTGRLADALLADFPEVEESVRVGNGFFRPRGTVAYEETLFEVNGLFAGTNFFEMMTYEVILGNPREAILNKNSVAISESLATSIFGSSQNAIGKTLDWEDRLVNKEFEITAVFKAPPKNASKHFNIVLNYDNLIERDRWADEWNGGYAQTYVILKKGTNIDDFNRKIAGYMNLKSDSDRFTLFVQKYADNYLYGEYTSGIQTGGRIENVRLFTFIGIFILAIACINFMNLSTAQASKKLKEVGVKKAIGAKRIALIFQFLSESILLATFSLILSIGIVSLTLQQFNVISGKSLDLSLQQYLLPITGLVVLTGIFAGSYPAFYLSGFKPAAILKGKLANPRSEGWIRKGLVIVQFSLSVIFIIGVIVINQQIEFTQKKSLGYDRESILTFRERGATYQDPQPFFNELMKIPGVLGAANMSGDFLTADDNNSGFSWIEGTKDDDNHLFKSPKVGYNFIETLGLEILEGRSFSRDFNDGIGSIILNEAAVEYMELDNPIGTKIGWSEDLTMEVIGVVKNFQYGSLHNKIEPLILQFRKTGKKHFVKLQPGSEVETIAAVEKAFETLHPGQIFKGSLLADDYTDLYHSENKVADLSNYMAGIAIIISCLGLFGLAAFTAERRTKEIGIRKILGASQRVIIGLLTSSFTKTVVISIVLALPLGYLAVSKWLENFAYAVEIQWWVFALAGLACLVIAWITVGFQTIKASMVNPAQCLRNE
ncbi:ABC transporter permease [Roseivirga sp. E12]|uniref:ABC transporter permease n=1 Tax=Roseivirga sp. E12 TaxID=2819237 RepID=UPI001ABD15E8|nr:ABC transporter permease [Roseivirga sp. E12]MBO3697515.1 ABC transporter permease [Roseivirga sp. E12]